MRTGTRGTGRTTLTRTLRTRSGTPARLSSPISHFEFPPSAISNRQWLARLENAATCRKQTPEVKSSRHSWEGRHTREGFSTQIPVCISSRSACLALNSTPYTSRSRIHANSLKTIAGDHFYPKHLDRNRDSYALQIGWRQADLEAGAIGLRVAAPDVHEMVNETRGISAEMALRLGRFFSTTPEFWINLQAHYDLSVSRQETEKKINRDAQPLTEMTT